MRGVRTAPTRRTVLAAGLAAAVAPARCAPAASRTLTVAAFPLVDQIVKDAAPFNGRNAILTSPSTW